jgi:quercetin dioxygenase-like cupin family protein
MASDICHGLNAMPSKIGRPNPGALLGIICVIAATTLSAGDAPQGAPPVAAPPPATPSQGVLGEARGFTGRTTTLDTTGYSVGRRVFEAGAHNATWHMHTAGQLIFAESGHGRFQIKGQPIHELAPGESGLIPGGLMHWHGAAPNENFMMMYVTMGASTTTQGEPVTDDVYLGKK